MNVAESRSDGFAMAVVVEGGLALLALVLAWVFQVPLSNQIPPWGAPLAWALGRGLVAMLPMLIVFWWLIHSQRPVLRRLREQVEWLIGEMFPQASVAQFGLIAALAGVGEELLFRGVIQSLLIDWTNSTLGIVITSFLFGAAHALSMLYFLLATLIGVYFGLLTLYYNDLVAPMIAHGTYDFVALLYLARLRRLRSTS